MKSKTYTIIQLIIPFLVIFGSIFILYMHFRDIIIINFKYLSQESLIITILTIFKILIVSLCGIYLMNSWLNQKHYYVSDLPFLIGLFFLIIIPSKLLDLLSTYIALQVVYEVFLAILKIRFIIAVINTLPLLFFSIGFLLYYISLTEKYGFLDDKNNRDKIQRIIVLMIIVAQLIAILFAIHHSSIITITSFLVFPSLLMITWIFVFSHKNRKYPKIDSLLVSIGFSLYLLTALFRSIAHFIIEPIFYISFSEIFESITIFIIFIGLIRKSN